MDPFMAILLGIVQGLTEWFPISSSGHFVVIQHLFIQGGLPFSFDIALHAATLLVLLIFFRREIWRIIEALGGIIKDCAKGAKLGESIRKSEDRLFAALVVVAMVPTGVIGFLVDKYITDVYMQYLLPVGIAFLVQGCLVISTKFGKGSRKIGEMNSKDALAIGTMQGLSALSGLSRSGSTISIGVALGIDRTAAARFSFIVAIPAFMASILLKFSEFTGPGGVELSMLAMGFASAFVVGMLTLRGLMYILRGTRFHLFAIYSFIFGCAVLALSAMGY